MIIKNAARIGAGLLWVSLMAACSGIVDTDEVLPLELSAVIPSGPPEAVASRVILISVDGLRPDAIDVLGKEGAPTFNRLRREGATTDNARTDYDFTITLPNHTSQLTGRGVSGAAGHGWVNNGDPEPGQTLHTNNGRYVSSVFDVVHEAGLRTVLFAGKSKFSLFEASYGRDDAVYRVNARLNAPSLDRFHFDGESNSLVDAFIEDLTTTGFGFGFLHFPDPDGHGHRSGWDLTVGSPYLESIRYVDQLIGRLMSSIESDRDLRADVAIILTSDHGGHEFHHGDATMFVNYRIPFYVWGAGVAAGADLYEINRSTRAEPGTSRPGYGAPLQPIRNGDAANLALRMMGLQSVPGSTINPESAPLQVKAVAGPSL